MARWIYVYRGAFEDKESKQSTMLIFFRLWNPPESLRILLSTQFHTADLLDWPVVVVPCTRWILSILPLCSGLFDAAIMLSSVKASFRTPRLLPQCTLCSGIPKLFQGKLDMRST